MNGEKNSKIVKPSKLERPKIAPVKIMVKKLSHTEIAELQKKVALDFQKVMNYLFQLFCSYKKYTISDE